MTVHFAKPTINGVPDELVYEFINDENHGFWSYNVNFKNKVTRFYFQHSQHPDGHTPSLFSLPDYKAVVALFNQNKNNIPLGVTKLEPILDSLVPLGWVAVKGVWQEEDLRKKVTMHLQSKLHLEFDNYIIIDALLTAVGALPHSAELTPALTRFRFNRDYVKSYFNQHDQLPLNLNGKDPEAVAETIHTKAMAKATRLEQDRVLEAAALVAKTKAAADLVEPINLAAPEPAAEPIEPISDDTPSDVSTN